MNRRTFLTRSVVATASVGMVTSPTLTAAPGTASAVVPTPIVPLSKGTLPTGKIAGLNVSRLISGGNLISGWAHSRDLRYVPSLMRAPPQHPLRRKAERLPADAGPD